MNRMRQQLKIEDKVIGDEHPTYFIADIAANHDGDLERAKDLIWMAKEAGADAAKFQHFKAETIVSDHGFRQLGSQLSHQAKWGKSVFEVYKEASIDLGWTPVLKDVCSKAGIAFFTSPYSIDLVDHIDEYVPAYKIGSGDITWLDIIRHVAGKGKPCILATGASTMDEVDQAVQAALEINQNVAVLQCNTNYTGSPDNFKYIQLNVLRSFRAMYPDLTLGLSDHTPGHACVLGAVALGGRIIEKHFTDDRSRIGPDHEFSMDPATWCEMIERTRELESALGNGIKRVEENEKSTVVVQRRCLRATTDLPSGHIIGLDDFAPLRPCPEDSMEPASLDSIVGKSLSRSIQNGDYIREADIE